MQIDIIASSSKGNACLISHGTSRLLIDAGISIKDLNKRLHHQLSILDGALISHSHMDHCRAVKDLMRKGIDCYMSEDTIRELNLNGHRGHRIDPLQQEKIGPWSILPFDLVHDSKGSLGFLVTIGNEKLLYACDTAYIKYKFKGLTYVMIECNYDLNILKEKIDTGETPKILKHRLISSHMNLNSVKEFLKVNDLSKVKEIWLLHLSDKHSDGPKFKEEIQKLTGKIVMIG